MAERISEATLEEWAKRIGHLVKVEGYAPPGKKVASGEKNAATVLNEQLDYREGSIRCHIRRMRKLGFDRHWEDELRRLPLKPTSTPARATAGRVFLLTAAQDQTAVHEPFWANLKAYAAYRGAQILIGGFTYQKGLFENHSVQAGIFHHTIASDLSPVVTELADGLTWYGKANILPTAVNPLAGWDTQTGESWAVFPHAKIALKTIPVMPGRRAKQIMTTGVVTLPNYVERNAGQKAEFHHTIGAAIVEIALDGAYWCRQINASADGSFQDLGFFVHEGKVSAGNKVAALNPGDLHADDQNEICARWCLGLAMGDKDPQPGNMLQELRPDEWFAHDSYSFAPRSHHTIKDPHERAMLHRAGNESVQAEISAVAQYLAQVRALGPDIVHVASNHNMHLDRWLKDPSAHIDPPNARYWHQLNAKWHAAIENSADHRYLIHEEAMRDEVPDRLEGVIFLSEGDSYPICRGVNPIECGLHSHIGPKGARGSISNLSNMPVRMNIGHSHTPGIKEGVYQSGTLARLSIAYANKGPTSWAPAHIVTYPNGNRSIITQWDDGRWRLE